MGVLPLLFLIGHLYLIGGWMSEDERNKCYKDTCLMEIGQGLQLLSTTSHSTVNTTGRTFVFNQGINKDALSMNRN